MAEQVHLRHAVPYVFCQDAGAISQWCQDVLGFVERGRWTSEDGVVTNVELVSGNVEVWLDGPVEDWPQRLEGLGSWIGLCVDDVDEVYRALHAKDVEVQPPADRGFGTRHLTVTDPEGHEWGFFQRT